jgi:hypothetical protein
MKTLSLTLSMLWAVARNTPTVLSLLWMFARNTPTILRHLPAAIALIGKIRAVFGSEAVQEFMKALHTFINRVAPPVPTTDSTGIIQTNPKQEQRRRLFQFRNRLEAAGILTDAEAQELCTLHGIGYGTGYGTDGAGIDGLQYA